MIVRGFRASRISSRITSLLITGLLMTANAWSAEQDGQIDFFEQKIRPILVQHCYECHSSEADDLQGEFRLDDRAAIRAGGPSGPAVVPGKPEESLILEALRYESLEMPPQGKLPDRVITDFERWIQVGAVDPREGETAPVSTGIDLERGREFWCFRPLQPTVPLVTDPRWADSPIDRFVRSHHERAGITASELADRATLIRRLYFDLVGMPPSPAQVDAFVDDPSPDAYSRLVDQLLSSVDFGPHWGRHWLDVVRYADSSGGGRTRILRDAWRYRDYVIEAFNADRRYDVFVAEQLAGDLLPSDSDRDRARQLTATGFLALGPTNFELQDKELLRMEVVDEQIDTLGRAMLGLTIGCARCHDHKFDPIPSSDYYALAGIFRSTQSLIHANVSDPVKRELPVSPQHRLRLEAHAAAVKELEDAIAQHQQTLNRANPQALAAVPTESLSGVIVDDSQIELTGSWVRSSHTPRYVGDGYRHDGDQLKGASRATFKSLISREGRYEVRVSYSAGNNRCSQVPVIVRHSDGQAVVFVDQTKQPPIDGLFASLGSYRFESGSTVEVVIDNGQTQGHVIVDAIQLLEAGSSVTDDAPPSTPELPGVEEEIKQLKAELKLLADNAPQPPDTVMSVQDEDRPEDACICIRGNVHNPGPRVSRGFLRVADHVERWELNAQESGRRELAAWICSETNPLTARVIANRVWLHLLGAGLVATPDNFGSTGQAPSHPRLLDYLALELMRQDWSIKHLIRQILHSRTYQLSSAYVSEAAKVDPRNQLLWRGNPRRLTAEQLRDGILACSGQLDRRIGGPAVREAATTEFGYQFEGNRRGVYLPIFRNSLLDLFDVFDVADPNIVVGRRNVSTRATQALVMMNSPFVMEQSALLADRLLVESGQGTEQRTTWLYRRVLGRAPTPSELSQTVDFVVDLQADGAAPAEAWTMVSQALFACLDFRYLR